MLNCTSKKVAEAEVNLDKFTVVPDIPIITTKGEQELAPSWAT